MNTSGAPVLATRRRFLAGGAASAAFAIVPRHILGGVGHVSPNSKLTVAAIGTGGQGLQNVQAFLEFSEIQVVAVCDVNRESGGYISWNWGKGNESNIAGREPARRMVEDHYAKERRSGSFRGCKAYVDYREMLAKEAVDAVMIATPDHSHAVIAMEALKRRKHVYCEKPLAYSPYEARRLTDAARQAGVATQLGNQVGNRRSPSGVRNDLEWRNRSGPGGSRANQSPVLGPPSL